MYATSIPSLHTIHMERSAILKYHIAGCHDKRYSQYTHLTGLQQWICKIFKITPVILFDCEFVFTLRSTEGLLPADIIRTYDGNDWRILQVRGNGITVISTSPRPKLSPNLYRDTDFVPIIQLYAEGKTNTVRDS